MRAFETLIRLSTERLSSRRQPRWLTPHRSRLIVIFVLAAGFFLVVVWACALAFLLYQLIAFALG